MGIDRYGNGVPALLTPVTDADSLAEILRQDHGFETEVIANERATLSELRAFLKALRERIGSDDRMLFYFAGHGIAIESEDGPKGYLLPQDADRSSTERYLPMVELNKALDALPCRHMLVILDCCFAGAFRWASTRDLILAPEQLHQERYAWFVRDAAWQAIASAAHDQKALDVAAGEALGARGQLSHHSPFAKALIDGLAGDADRRRADGTGDGVITATELYLYLEEQLMPAPESGRPRQTPILWPLKKHDKGQFVFLVPGRNPDLPPAPTLNPDANPWRGLKPYESSHSDLFFGRRRATERLLERVLSERFVVVTGPSGIGKSSLVRAGLLPQLPDGIHPIVVRPGPAPFASLAVALRDAGAAQDGSPDEQALGANPLALADWVKGQEGAADDILLVVDQAEELITMSHDAAITKSYLGLIANALKTTAQLRIAFTVRSEFEPQFAAQSPLSDRWSAARYLVPQMTPDELRRVIEGPATVKVMCFESDELIDKLVNEVVQMPGALPLLSFALSEMYVHYLRRRGDDRTLTHKDYDALEGGVTGSLRVRANHVLDSMDGPHQETTRRLLERLVSVEAGEYARRRVPRRELEAGDATEQARINEVVRRLDEARLIVTDETDNEPHLELAHDALILGWDRLHDWLRADAQRMIALRRLTADVELWTSASAPTKEFLWSDSARNATLRDLVSAKFPGLNGVERRFADASVKRLKWNKGLRTAIVAGLVSLTGLAVVAASLYAFGEKRGEMDRLLATARSFDSSGDTPRTYAYALAALEKGHHLSFLWEDRGIEAASILVKTINHGVPIEYGLFDTTFDVSLSDDGKIIAAIGRLGGGKKAENLLVVGPPNDVSHVIAEGWFLATAFRPQTHELYVAKYVEKHIEIQHVNPNSGELVDKFPISEFSARRTNPRPFEIAEPRFTPNLVDEMLFVNNGNTLVLAGWASLDPQGMLKQPWRAYLNVQTGAIIQHVSEDSQIDMPYDVHHQRIAANRDGSKAVSAGINEVYVDDTMSGERAIVGTRQRGSIRDVALSPSGNRIIASRGSKTLTALLKGATGEWKSYQLALPGEEAVELVRFISEDSIAATRSDYGISVGKIRSKEQLGEPRLDSPRDPSGGMATRSATNDKAESPAEAPLFRSDRFAVTAIREALPEPEEQLQADVYFLRGHTGRIRVLLIDREHDRIFSGGEDREIRLWGINSGERRVLKGSERSVAGMLLSESRGWLISRDIGGKILAWHLPDGISPIYSGTAPDKVVEERISTDDYLGAGDGGSLTAYVNRLDAHFVADLAATQDGRYLAVRFYGGSISVIDRIMGRTREFKTKDGRLRFSEDGRYLMVGQSVRTVADESGHSYSTSVPPLIKDNQWTTIEHGVPAFHAFVEGTGDQSGVEELELDDDEERAFSPDKKLLVSLARRRYCFWTAPFESTGHCGQLPSPWSFTNEEITFLPNSYQFIATAQSNGQRRLMMVDPTLERARIFETGELGSSFAISKDGTLLAAAGRYGELYVGKADGSRMEEVGRHSRQILSIAFSADRRWIATGSLDRTVRVWSAITFESAQYDFLNPVQSVIYDDATRRFLIASGSSVFSIVQGGDDWDKLLVIGSAASNVRARPGETSATALVPVRAAALP